MRHQKENGIVERVDEKSQCQNNRYYTPHKAVVKETAQTTKLSIVYNASAKSSSKNVSLNVLKPGLRYKVYFGIF